MKELPKGLNNCFEPSLVEQRLVALGVSPETGQPLKNEDTLRLSIGARIGLRIGHILTRSNQNRHDASEKLDSTDLPSLVNSENWYLFEEAGFMPYANFCTITNDNDPRISRESWAEQQRLMNEHGSDNVRSGSAFAITNEGKIEFIVSGSASLYGVFVRGLAQDETS
jgi:hypothetical protein